MNQLQIFNFNNANIRIIENNGQPWFALVDVCKILEIGNPSDVKSRLDDGVVTIEGIPDQLGRIQHTTIINEDGLYDVILDSRKPEAREFRRWITRDVIPSIRKTGSYTVDKPKSQAQLLLAYAEHFVQMEQRQQQLENKIDTLTTGLTATPDHTKVVARVNELARWSRMGHNEVYNKIYDILKAKHGIDVRQRVENERHKINVERFNSTGKYYAESTLKSRVNGIDVMVRMGVLDKFNEILVGMLTRAKGA